MKSLILICALGLSHADCAIDTATAVIQGPEGRGPAQCGFLAQAYLAGTSLAGYLDGSHYLKIACSPHAPHRADADPEPDGRSVAAR
jgi:hypothetical protein